MVASCAGTLKSEKISFERSFLLFIVRFFNFKLYLISNFCIIKKYIVVLLQNRDFNLFYGRSLG